MEYILSICVIFLEVLSLNNFGDTFLKKNKKINIINVYILFIFSTFILTNFIFKTNTTYKFLISLSILIITFYLLYDEKIYLNVLISLIAYFILFAFDYIFILIFLKLFNISYSSLVSSVSSFCTVTLLSKFTLFSLSYLFRIIYKNKFSDTFDRKYLILSIAFPIFSIITLIILFNVSIMDNANSYWIIVDVFGIVIANIFIIYILEKMNIDSKVKHENIILEQRLKAEISNLEYVKSMYENQRKLSHDFSNHIHTIRNLAISNASKEIVDYTNELSNNIMEHNIVIDTHNNTINAVINQKFYHAKQLGISVRFDINDLSDFPLSSNDCVIVLANALDNAIKSAAKGFDKIIKVKILKDSSTTIISIINSSEPVTIIDNSYVISNRTDISHGYGLNNIKAALSKYNHIFAIDYDSGLFQMTIIINE